VIGAAIIAIGFYAVLWGRAQEESKTSEKHEAYGIISSSSSGSETILLLHTSKDTMIT